MSSNNEKLIALISRVLDIDKNSISDLTSPENTESWDSFNGLVLVDELENHFNIKFSISEITDVKTVADIKRHLKNHDVSLND